METMSVTHASAGGWLLHHRGRIFALPPGAYLVGRDSNCNIVLSDGRVSRRHARLVVDHDHIFIEDLGSMNGLFVNGSPVSGSQAIYDGDWLSFGGEEVELSFSPQKTKHISVVPPSSTEEFDQRFDRAGQVLEDDEDTEHSRSLEILGAIAESSLERHQHADAEDMLKTTLLDVLNDAQSGLPIERDAFEFCVRYATKLTEETRKRQWLDYLVDLYRALKCPCDPEVERAMGGLLDQVRNPDRSRLSAWADTLRASGDSEVSRTASRVERLLTRVLESR